MVLTYLETILIDHIENDSIFTETTSDRIKKFPNGDKRIDFSVTGEKPYGLDKLNYAMSKNPWFGCDYHIKDSLDAKATADIINGYVKTNDHLIILGDMEDHDDPDIDVVSEFVKSIKCVNKYLILGNNDSFPLDEYKKMGFKTVTDTYYYENLVIAHFPMNVDDGHICIHGHLHGCAQNDPNKYWFCDPAKCIDVWEDNYIPRRLNDLLKRYNRWHTESVIEEGVNITYSNSKEDVINIIETLPIKERGYIASNNYDKKSFPQIFISKTKNLIYREVMKINDIPVGFIDIYSFNKSEGFIVLAIRGEEQYRHKGYGKILVTRAIDRMKSNKKINKLIWEFDNDNVKSALMADNLGFYGDGTIREMIIENVIEESVNKTYYRFTYDGEGIYEALKKKVRLNTWKSLLTNQAINWLPKPPSYFSGYTSYFTEKGYNIFTDKTLPFIKKYLSSDKIEVKVYTENKIGYVCYSDEYQVCTTDENGITLLNISKFNYEMNYMSYQLRNKYYQLDRIRGKSDFDKYYRLLTPQEFIKYGGGVCWDYVVYQAYYFKKFYPGVKFYTFYHQTVHEDPNDAPTHSFMIFTINNKWYWFESSWKINMGIWEFNSLDEALNFIMDALIMSAENEPSISIYIDHFLVSYNPLNQNIYGMTCVQFMNLMCSLPEFRYKKINIVKNYKRYVDKEQYRQINGIVLTESCKDVVEARKLVKEVQRISKRFNANFFFVTDGASGYSNGNGQNNPAVKAMRQAMDKWEISNGFNPDDDWSNDITDMSGYKTEEVMEEFHLDTMIAEPSTFFKGITLFHYSNRNMNKIIPRTVNVGNKLSKPRLSSWWTTNLYQGGWVLFMGLTTTFPEEKKKRFIWSIGEIDGKKQSIGVIAESLIREQRDWFNNFKVYKYTKNFKPSEVGMGTEYSVKEYTCDKEVIPDKKEILPLSEVMKSILIVPDSQMPSYVRKWNDLRDKGLHMQDALVDKKPWIYWDYEKGQELKRKYVKKHPEIETSHDIDRTDDSEIIESVDYFKEEANYNKRNIYPVFIVLTQTDGIFAKATKLTTNSDWSHATIAFNPELNPYYSFGCKSLHPLKFGLMTNGEDAFHDTDKARYAIYVMYVNKTQYKKLKAKMQYYINNKENLSYSWIGLPRLLLKLPHDYGDKYFCSQFVMTLIGEIINLPKDPSLWAPGDIEFLDNITKVCSGEDLREYDSEVTKRNLEYVKVKQFGKLKLESANDSFKKYMKGIID